MFTTWLKLFLTIHQLVTNQLLAWVALGGQGPLVLVFFFLQSPASNQPKQLPANQPASKLFIKYALTIHKPFMNQCLIHEWFNEWLINWLYYWVWLALLIDGWLTGVEAGRRLRLWRLFSCVSYVFNRVRMSLNDFWICWRLVVNQCIKHDLNDFEWFLNDFEWFWMMLNDFEWFRGIDRL